MKWGNALRLRRRLDLAVDNQEEPWLSHAFVQNHLVGLEHDRLHLFRDQIGLRDCQRTQNGDLPEAANDIAQRTSTHQDRSERQTIQRPQRPVVFGNHRGRSRLRVDQRELAKRRVELLRRLVGMDDLAERLRRQNLVRRTKHVRIVVRQLANLKLAIVNLLQTIRQTRSVNCTHTPLRPNSSYQVERVAGRALADHYVTRSHLDLLQDGNDGVDLDNQAQGELLGQ